MEPDEADRRWAAITDHPPNPYLLRAWLPERWIRFHNLPGKRWPQTDDDWAEVHRRTSAIFAEVFGDAADLLVTSAWFGDEHDRPGPPPKHPGPADYWRGVEMDPGRWLHLWTSHHRFEPGSLDDLVRLTADDALAGVLLVDADRRFALHPYDGGLDVLAPDAEERQRLLRRFPRWAEQPRRAGRRGRPRPRVRAGWLITGGDRRPPGHGAGPTGPSR